MSAAEGVLSDPKEAKTFPQLIRAAAAAYGNEIAVTHMDEAGETDASISFAELERKSDEISYNFV